MSDEKKNIAGFDVCPRFEGLDAFNPEPTTNHMSHWMPWVSHFKDSPDHDTRILANMLGAACEEINRLCERMGPLKTAQAELLFAFIDLVETGKPKPFKPDDDPGISGAWASIQLLNQWRKENKLNIRQVDIS